MGWQFNPFTGTLDQTGSGGGGGGTSYDQSLNTTDSVQFQTVHVNTTSNAGNPLVWKIGDLGEFAVYTDGTKRGALSLDDSLGKLNFYNSTSLSAFSLTDDGNVVIGYYYGPAVSVNNNGVTSFASGSAQIDASGNFITNGMFQSAFYSGGSGAGTAIDAYGNFQFGSGFSMDSGHSWCVCGPAYSPAFFTIETSSSWHAGDLGSRTLVVAPWTGGDGNGNGGGVFTSRNTLDDGYGNAIFTSIWNSGGGGLTTDGTNLYWNGTQIS